MTNLRELWKMSFDMAELAVQIWGPKSLRARKHFAEAEEHYSALLKEMRTDQQGKE